VNVVVVGAGVAGLAIGWRLAQSGSSVTVLDRAQPARGATWAAAGMLAAAAEAGGAATPEALFAHRARDAWPDFAREVEAASGRSICYRQSGALMVGQELEAHGELSRLTRDEARAMEPLLAETVAGALWAPNEAQVDNRALGDALAVAFARAGGVLVANEAVLRFEIRHDRAVAVHTAWCRREADAFVLAAGAWSGQIEGLPGHAIPKVTPMKGEMLALAPKDKTALPTHVVWGNGVYLVPRPDRLLIGATLEDAGFDSRPTRAARDWLLARAVSLMPALAGWRIVEHWAGLRPASADGMPILGQSIVDGLFVATGQHRNGILFAPLVAETLLRSVLERPVERQAFDPRRFAGSLAPIAGVR